MRVVGAMVFVALIWVGSGVSFMQAKPAQTDAAPSFLRVGACLEFDLQGTWVHLTKKVEAVEGHWFYADDSWWNIELMRRVAPKDCK